MLTNQSTCYIIGMNGLTDFKEWAAMSGWTILADEHFMVSPYTNKVNATNELLRLRERGTRVVILNCEWQFVTTILEQASNLDMIKDWVWILTDGAIAEVGRNIKQLFSYIGSAVLSSSHLRHACYGEGRIEIDG